MLQWQPKDYPARCFTASESAWTRTESLLPPAREEGQHLCPQGHSQVKPSLPSHVWVSPVATCFSLSPYGMGQPGNHSHGVALPWPPTQPGDITVHWLLPEDLPGRQCFCLFPLLAPPAMLLPSLSICNRFHMLRHPSSTGTRESGFMLWLRAPGTAPLPSLSTGRMGCRQGRQRGRLAFLAPALVGQMRAGPHAALPSLHQPLHLSWGGWLTPPEMDPVQRAAPESSSWPVGRFGSRHRHCL